MTVIVYNLRRVLYGSRPPQAFEKLQRCVVRNVRVKTEYRPWLRYGIDASCNVDVISDSGFVVPEIRLVNPVACIRGAGVLIDGLASYAELGQLFDGRATQ